MENERVTATIVREEKLKERCTGCDGYSLVSVGRHAILRADGRSESFDRFRCLCGLTWRFVEVLV
jgi:hypothetical protein